MSECTLGSLFLCHFCSSRRCFGLSPNTPSPRGGDFISESPDCVNDYVKSPETGFILAAGAGASVLIYVSQACKRLMRGARRNGTLFCDSLFRLHRVTSVDMYPAWKLHALWKRACRRVRFLELCRGEFRCVYPAQLCRMRRPRGARQHRQPRLFTPRPFAGLPGDPAESSLRAPEAWHPREQEAHSFARLGSVVKRC